MQDYIQSAIADTVRVMHSTVDMTARNEINAVKQAQQSHERYCERRDKEGKEAAARAEEQRAQVALRIETVVAGINKLLITGAISIIMILLTIVGFLIAPTFHH